MEVYYDSQCDQDQRTAAHLQVAQVERQGTYDESGHKEVDHDRRQQDEPRYLQAEADDHQK